MNLDDLLPLLLVAFFVVNAFLRGGRARRSRGGGAPGRAPRRGGPPAQGPEAGEAPGPEPGSAQDLLSKRLEEARRRVRAATESGSGGERAPTASDASRSSSGRSSPSTASSPSTPATSAPRSATPPPAPGPGRAAAPAPLPAFLGREGSAPPRRDAGNAPSDGFLGREGAPSVDRRRPKREARSPTSGERSARLPAAVGIDFEPGDIVRGVIWSEVLGPPLAARRRRRTVSRRRSH